MDTEARTEYNYGSVIDIIAYFVKYGGVSFEFDWEKLCSDRIKKHNVDYKGKKCFQLDQYVEWDIFHRLSKLLATAPWLGEKDGAYINVIRFLVEKKILSIYLYKEYDRAKKSYINIIEFTVGIAVSEEDNKARNDYILKDGPDKFRVIMDIVKELNPTEHITIKMASFHARTIMDIIEDKEQLKMLLDRYPRLCFQLLIIGKNSPRVARENASNERFKQAYMSGVVGLYKELGKYKDRVIIKSVPNSDEIAYFRGTIILRENDIKYCSRVFWRYGRDRGIYSKALKTYSDNSFSRISNALFTRYFAEAHCENRVLGKVWYWMRFTGLKVIIATVITILLTYILECLDCENVYCNSLVVGLVMYYGPERLKKIRRRFFIS